VSILVCTIGEEQEVRGKENSERCDERRASSIAHTVCAMEGTYLVVFLIVYILWRTINFCDRFCRKRSELK
jgi:hypothetical protein